MKKPAFFTDREARGDLRDKFEVFMAVVVLSSYVHKKYKQSQKTTENLEQE